MESVNPYAAPVASVESTASSDTPFDALPRFSAWFVFLLGTITLSLYYYWWLFSRTNIINKVSPQNPISLMLAWVAIASVIVTSGLDIAEVVAYANMDPGMREGLVLFNNLLSLVGFVVWFVWVFAIRNRIISLATANKQDSSYPGGILTFFFGPIYLAYKINQIKDELSPYSI